MTPHKLKKRRLQLYIGCVFHNLMQKYILIVFVYDKCKDDEIDFKLTCYSYKNINQIWIFSLNLVKLKIIKKIYLVHYRCLRIWLSVSKNILFFFLTNNMLIDFKDQVVLENHRISRNQKSCKYQQAILSADKSSNLMKFHNN